MSNALPFQHAVPFSTYSERACAPELFLHRTWLISVPFALLPNGDVAWPSAQEAKAPGKGPGSGTWLGIKRCQLC